MKIQQQWDRLSADDQRLITALAVFSGYINMGATLISAYVSELRRFKSFRTLPKEKLPDLIRFCLQSGWFSRREDFPHTEILQVNPVFYLFLQNKYSELFSDKEHNQVEKAFVRYYDWMGNNLYTMLIDSEAEEYASGLLLVSLDYGNLYNALQWSLKQQLYDFTFILLPLNQWLDAVGKHDLWKDIVFSMLAHLEGIPAKKRSVAIWFSLTHLYDTLGSACLRMRDFGAAEHYFRLAIDAYFDGKQDQTYPEAFGGLSQNYAATLAYQEKWAESEAAYTQMLQIAEQHNHLETIANYYLNYGICLMQQGKNAGAADLLKIAVEKNQERNDVYSVGLANLHLGSANIALEHFEEAAHYLESAMQCFADLEDTISQAEVWDAIVNLHLRRRDFVAAKKAARQSLEWHIRHGKNFHQALIFQSLAVACIGMAEWEEGQDYLVNAARLFRQTGDEQGVDKILGMARHADEKTGRKMEAAILSQL